VRDRERGIEADGPIDADAVVTCPYCGEQVEVSLDPAGGRRQEYVEDCEVCCNPWRVRVRYDPGTGRAQVEIEPAS